MAIINFQNSPKKSFIQGFWKGLGAPFMLFGSFSATVQMPKVDPVELPSRFGDAQGDLFAIGGDLNKALAKYDQQAKPQ